MSCEWILRITEQKGSARACPSGSAHGRAAEPAMGPLSKAALQCSMCWIERRSTAETPDAAWQEAMLLSIIGIAAAMQSTG